MQNLQKEYVLAKNDPSFWQEYLHYLRTYSCRATPLTFAEGLTRHLNGARIYIKREDLNHTGSHKFNNVLGQALLTKRMGKKRLIAETGAGQHGVATATIAAKFGLKCTIYMGETDVKRQYPNVFWMKKLGAEVVPVTYGTATLKDAIDEALRDWAANFQDTHYLLGTACGPHPFPEMIGWFQSVISEESRAQILEFENRLPTAIYACVGGGSNAAGSFAAYIEDENVKLVGVEAGGKGINLGKHAARIASGEPIHGISQGYKTYFLQNVEGQMQETYSVAAGLDYVGVSPIISDLHDKGRVTMEAVTDDEVMKAISLSIEKEGLIPALESAHAFAQAFRDAAEMAPNDVIIVNQSGRGDKDIFTIADAFQDEEWKEFVKQYASNF